MAILLWLLPALLATIAASTWAAWMSRSRPANEVGAEAKARAQQRMGAAIARPNVVGQGPRRSRESSTGVAVRRKPRL